MPRFADAASLGSAPHVADLHPLTHRAGERAAAARRREARSTIGALITATLLFAALIAATVVSVMPADAASLGARAEFERVSKRVAGHVSVAQDATGRALVTSEDFRVGSGPDVLVLLHRDADPKRYGAGEFISLGRMAKFDGAQRFAIPDDVDLSDYASVVLWCRRFDVTFAVAAF